MLVISRRNQESLMIGDDVQMTILRINGNQVRIGFEAPKDVSIHREEIYKKIQADKNLTTPKDINAYPIFDVAH